MPPLTSIDCSLLTPPKTTVCLSIHTVPSTRTLESMPPEILDRIASFVRCNDILRLCHAVPLFKYISKATFDFAHGPKLRRTDKPVKSFMWPYLNLVGGPFESTLPVPVSHLHALQTYSTILNKHGGYASIDDSIGMEGVLGAVPESLDLIVDTITRRNAADDLFSTMFSTNKNIRQLNLGAKYLDRCFCDPDWLYVATKWLAKLRVRELRFPRSCLLPTKILGMLHLMPTLGSLQLRTLQDCAAVALSECTSLWKLSIYDLFEGRGSPEMLVQKLLDLVEPTKIQEVAVLLPWGFQEYEAAQLVLASFLERGWDKQPARYEKNLMREYFSLYSCEKAKISNAAFSVGNDSMGVLTRWREREKARNSFREGCIEAKTTDTVTADVSQDAGCYVFEVKNLTQSLENLACGESAAWVSSGWKNTNAP
ncbi:hypothetical protein HDU81_009377 [Chytriomyces hyalinus]|nr:hypothetical protein HDU81_009377 [Chytriomyces hyalinus]